MIKKFISFIVFITVLLTSLTTSCYKEKEWSEDYDIDYPVSTITNVSPMKQNIGGTVTVTGTNLELVQTVYIGNLSCEIQSQSSTNIVFIVPGAAQRNFVSVENKYQRLFIYEEAVFEPLP